MRLGGSLFLIALGAILKFAVTDSVKGISLGTVGVILMIVGLVGLVAEAFYLASRRRRDVVVTHQQAYVDPPVVEHRY